MKYLILLLFVSSAFGQGKDRWLVKTLSDGFIPDTVHTEVVSVKYLASLPRVRVGDHTARMQVEKRVVRLLGRVSRVGLESDSDVHIEVIDGTLLDSTAVCEVPMKFAGLHLRALRLKVGDSVSVAGVLFQDKVHGKPTKRISNYMEIHPVTELVVLR